MRVVVTGGAGFIGSNLCRTLAGLVGVDQVIALDDFSTGRKENLADQPGVELAEGTILDAGFLDAVLEGADAVVHLAALPSVPRSIAHPLASHQINATGTVMVLEAARRFGSVQVIVASSSSVYGANPTMPKHEDLVPMPLSPYAASKLAAESYALAWASSFGQKVLVLRFFNVFGPGQTAGHAYAAVVPSFVEAALAGRPLVVHGDGGQTRDFTYVGSVATVLGQAVARGVSSDRPVNLAFGSTVSLRELIVELEALLGRRLTIEHVDPRPGDVRHSTADQTRLRVLFEDIEPVSLHDGLRATIAWFQRSAIPWMPPTPRVAGG